MLAGSNRGACDFDIRHAFSAGVTYDLPGPASNPFMRGFLRGWSVDNIVQARSAPQVDVSDVNNFFQFNGGFFGNVRPDLVSGQPVYLYGSQYPGGKALNSAAFTDPPPAPIGPDCPFGGCPTRQGTTPRNFLRAFGGVQWDLGIHRDFPVHESVKLQFRAEMFNVLNHPNFGPPDNLLGDPTFGMATQMLGRSLAGGTAGGGSFTPLYQIGGARSVQLALEPTI